MVKKSVIGVVEERKKLRNFAFSMNINRIFTAAAAAVVATCLNAQTTMTLTGRQQALVGIAANEAKGNIDALRVALNEGFEQGLTLSEAKEALSQLYAYTGFPRSLNALGALQQVVRERQAAGLVTEPGREADPMPADYDALRQGTEVQTRLSGQPFNYDFSPQTDYYLKAHLFGDIFARNNLSHSDREIVTVSAIAALPGCEPQLRAHVAGALNMGVTREQLTAIPAVLAAKAGTDEAVRCVNAINEVCKTDLQLTDAPAKTVDFSVWPKGEPNTGYAQYFIGNSYLAPLSAENGGPVNVTFEPRCRNNWHIHHNQVQVLICVSGRGWYQEWGKEPVAMTPGTVVAIPAEAKHWHGAARDSWFQHLTYHTHVGEGASNEWLEPVDDEHYDKLK